MPESSNTLPQVSPSQLSYLNNLGMMKLPNAEGTLIRIMCSGEYKRTLLFFAPKVDTSEHPLIPSGVSIAYFSKLRARPAMGIMTWENNGDVYAGLRATQTRITNPRPVNLDAVDRSTRLSESHAVDRTGMDGVNYRLDARNPAVPPGTVKVRVSFPAGRLRVDEFTTQFPDPQLFTPTTPMPSRIGPGYAKMGGGFPTLTIGTYSYPVLDDETNYFSRAIKSLPVAMTDLLTSLPLYVDGGASSAPFVRGARRFYMLFPSNGSLRMLTGYIAGEGPDIVQVRCIWAQDGRAWNHQVINIPVSSISSVNSSNIGESASITSTNAYAINGPVQFVNDLLGDLTSLGRSSSLVNDDQFTLNVVDYGLNVRRVTGVIGLEDYAEYLATGYGVLKPLAESRVSEVISSWAKVTRGFNYALRNEECAGRSVKELSLYSEYGKRRAKACKTNNFLELPYNQEYTYQQVENKLRNLQSRDAWMWPVDDTPAQSKSVVPTKGKVELRKLNDLQFSAIIAGAASGRTYPLTEDGITAMFDKYEGYEIQGWEIIAEMVRSDGSGSTMSGYMRELNKPIDASPYFVGMIEYVAGYALTYEEVVKILDVDAQIRFLMSQVTDFAKFDQALLKIIYSFTDDVIFAAMKANDTPVKV